MHWLKFHEEKGITKNVDGSAYITSPSSLTAFLIRTTTVRRMGGPQPICFRPVWVFGPYASATATLPALIFLKPTCLGYFSVYPEIGQR
jgi:hypothetical protein